MSSLSEISIRRPVFAWMLMFFLIVFGGVSFMRLGVSQLPDVDFPIISVSLSLDGAAPEVMETDVVDVVEDGLMSIEGVKSITSSSKNSAATITVEFVLGRNLDLALQDVQAKLAQVQRNLPREMDPPVISKTNPEDQPILWLALSNEKMSKRDLMAYVRDQLKDQFSTVPGVGEIFLGGYVDPALRVWVDDAKLRRLQFAVGDVIDTIKNEHSEPPAGRIESGAKEFNVRTMGEAQSVDEFKSIAISTRGGLPNFTKLRIRDVADVEDGLADIRRLSRAGGKAAIGLGIRKQRGSNAVEVAKGVKAKLAAVQKNLPPGSQLQVIFDSTKFIEEAVGELTFTLLLSALLTALVCWMFLGSWTSTLNVVLAIPTSIVGTFMILYFAGFTLNTFTLLALSLAIGIVVDDAIMVLENIIRHREMGKDRTQAALDGSKEIAFAAIAATVSIIAIFLPVAFMKGIIGKFFFQFGVTMTGAVALSLLEALTLTPMRCAQFVDLPHRTTRFGIGLERLLDRTTVGYRHILDVCLRYRWAVIVGSVLFFAASIFSLRYINVEMLPAEDQSRFLIRVQTPVGSSIAYTDEKMKSVEKFLLERPDVDRFFMSVGGFGGGDVNIGMAFVTLKAKGERKLTQQQVMDETRVALNKVGGYRATVQDLSMRGFSASRGFPVEFSVQGPEFDELAKYSQKIVEELEKTGLVTDADTDYQVGMPEVRIIPDRDRANLRGVSVGAIGETINALIGGVQVGRYARGGHRYDIRVKLKDDNRPRADRIKDLYVRNNRGELISLGEVVKLEEKPTLQAISRMDRSRAVQVFANVKAGASQQLALQAAERIGHEVLPSGYSIVMSGGSQTSRESFQSLLFALGMGLIVAYMVLASQFNSFIHPITVLVALPFSISGAFISLLAGHQSLNLYSMIGLILLMGIVKKNSILLVDFTNQVRETDHLPVREALLKACPVRLRPILMTSIATIAGAIPPAIGVGPGAESRIPMAVAIIGGVLVSTVLTLIVVPAFYSIVSRETRSAA